MRALGRPVYVLAVLTAMACGQDAGSAASGVPYFSVGTEVPAEVEFGVPFSLRVTIALATGYEADPFDDRWLAPLAVELMRNAQTQVGAQTTVTRTYRARAFVPDRVVVPRFEFRATRRSDGDVQRMVCGEFELQVRSALAGHDAEPEGAGGLVPLPTIELHTLPMVIVGAVLVVLGALLRLRRRAPPPVAVPVAAAEPDPREQLRIELAALVRAAGEGAGDEQRFCADLAAALRRFASASLHCDATTATTEELLAVGARRWSAPAHAEASAVLTAIDLVKFAAARAPAAVRAQMLAGVERFLAATAAVPA